VMEPSLIMLSELMRYMLYDSEGKKVMLDKEIAYLKSYIELQKLRFGSDTQIETIIELEEGAGPYSIEPMLLIPFVENAFKHGIGWIDDPWIYVRLVVAESILQSVAGGFLGIGLGLALLAWGGFAVGAEGVTIAFKPSLDLAMSGAIVTIVVGVLAGLAPGWQTARTEIVHALRQA